MGYSTVLGRLKAVISINQSSGYNGALCTPGSREYVRFYLSFDNDTTRQDRGAASCTVNALPDAKPLHYAVALPVSVPEYLGFFENLPLVRAILSWNYNVPTNTPDFVPVWGSVLQAAIQIPPNNFILFTRLLADCSGSHNRDYAHVGFCLIAD